MSSLPSAVASYARRFHAAVPGHHVVSPLGAWLLLALLAPEAERVAAERLSEALGMPAREAADAASALLERPHPAVASALALWTKSGLERARYDAWAAGLPAAVTRDVLPAQDGLDAWARERTLGLVKAFPLTLQDDTVSVLASALATKVVWRAPFEVVPSSRLGSPWAVAVSRVLLSPRYGHVAGVVDAAAGRCGVHAATSEDGLLTVVSVVGPPGAPRDDVLTAAHEVSARAVVGEPGAPLGDAVDVFSLPVGEGHAWAVTEERGWVVGGGGREVHASAVLPAWTANTDVDLLADPGTGFADAGGVLMDLLRPLPAPSVEARQAAVARYTASGFEAAAVTGLAVPAGAMLGSEGVVRTLEVRFGRPYAVVAVARSGVGPGAGSPAWEGVPVFSAWVEEPAEAEELEYRTF